MRSPGTDKPGDRPNSGSNLPCYVGNSEQAIRYRVCGWQNSQYWSVAIGTALQTVEHLEIDLESFEDTRAQKKLLKALRELDQYLILNKAFILNYGDRYRHGETISTAFVESTVNQVISTRMGKKQQMGWTPRGAHLLLQVRTRVLNEELREIVAAWYPGMEPVRQLVLKEAA